MWKLYSMLNEKKYDPYVPRNETSYIAFILAIALECYPSTLPTLRPLKTKATARDLSAVGIDLEQQNWGS